MVRCRETRAFKVGAGGNEVGMETIALPTFSPGYLSGKAHSKRGLEHNCLSEEDAIVSESHVGGGGGRGARKYCPQEGWRNILPRV